MEATSPTQPKAKNRRSSAKNSPPPNLSSATRHERLCTICQHPRREDIDDDILRWRSPQDIVYDFDLADRSAVYRHARATNLFRERKENLNPALERVIESVYDAKPSMNAVLKAMAIYARINGNEAYKSAFTEPPKHTIITHVSVHPDEQRTRPDEASIYRDEGRVHPEERRNRAENGPPPETDAGTTTEGHGVTCPDEGRSPAEDSLARTIHPDEGGTTLGSPAGALENDLTIFEPPASGLQPPECPVGARENDLEISPPSTSNLKTPGHVNAIEAAPMIFADGPAEVVLKKHPELKRFAPFLSVLVPVVLLGVLLWTALLGIASTVSASTVYSESAPRSVPAENFPLRPLRHLTPPPPVFYPPQNLQSKIQNSLKRQPKLIFYSPQKTTLPRGKIAADRSWPELKGDSRQHEKPLPGLGIDPPLHKTWHTEAAAGARVEMTRRELSDDLIPAFVPGAARRASKLPVLH